MLYNKFHTFLAREIPYSVAVTQNRKVRATVEVETLDAWTPDEATLGSPTQAPAGGAFRVPGGVIAGGLLSKQQPVYPYLAKQNHIQGSVVLAAVISKQGTIQALELIDSPDESLTSASAEAVRHWRYKPYLLNGEPAEVDTTITVNFNFN